MTETKYESDSDTSDYWFYSEIYWFYSEFYFNWP